MALDSEHHLEGTLAAPDLFRLYVYDSRLQPVAAGQLTQTKVMLHWGEYAEGVGIPLAVSQDGQALQTKLNKTTKFPLSLTALVEFPDKKSGDKPELFTFTFDKFSPEQSGTAEGAAHPPGHAMD